MTASEKTKRSYKSTRRQVQARQTRHQIVEAARRLFTERGYSGATISAIAEDAGVAVETVYAIFGNKKAILSHLVDVSVVGDDEQIPLLERPGPQAVKSEHDQHKQVQMFARDIGAIMARMAPLFEVMNIASKTEPEIADLLNRLLQERLQGMQFFVNALAGNVSLREGLNPGDAAETVWAITSAEIFSLLTVKRGWSGSQYEVWLANTLTRLLLPE